MKCLYREDTKELKEKDCIDKDCYLCLIGQLVNEQSLTNLAIGNLTASIEESLCRQTIDRFEEIAKKYPKIEERICREEQK